MTHPTHAGAGRPIQFSSACRRLRKPLEAALRACVDIRLEEAPPAIGLALPGRAGASRPPPADTSGRIALGLRTLEAVGRRIDARRISRGRAFAAAGDPGWNPLFASREGSA